MNRSGLTAVLVFCAIYALLVVPVTLLPTDLIGFLIYCLYLLLAICIALDLTEIILSLFWDAARVPRVEASLRRTSTAVLMVICDDFTDTCLRGLLPLADAGYAAFVLDDSGVPATLPDEIAKRVRHIWRGCRDGAKAGNLNHWLVRYGSQYDHAIILDADSRMSLDCADALLASAVHPENARIAQFQSKIQSQNCGSLFNMVIAASNRPRVRLLTRVHARLGLLLSAGHNLLVRLAPLRRVGGFDETIAAEDTALSLALASRGWGTVLVDAWSEDTEPATTASYNRRAIRWARQTVELLQCPWSAAPFRLKLLLLRHLLNYLFPILGTAMLTLSIWFGPSRFDDTLAVLIAALRFQHGLEVFGLAVWIGMTVMVLLPLLRLYLGWAEGVGIRKLILALLFSGANYPALIMPLARGMLASALGTKVVFVPTNSRAVVRQHSLSQYEAGLSSLCLSAALMAGLVMHPASGLLGFTGVWLCCFIVSPPVLRLAELLRRKRMFIQGCNR